MKILIIFLFIYSFSSLAETQDEIQELRKRIEILEFNDKNFIGPTGEPQPQVNSYVNDGLTLGGFYDGGFTFLAGPDTDTQLGTASHVLGFNISTAFIQNFRFVSQFISSIHTPLMNRHNNPDAPTVGLPESREFSSFSALAAPTKAYGEYIISRMFNIQGGLGYVPFGYVLQLREPVLFVRRGAPQLARNPNIVPELWSGIHVHGSASLDGPEAGYNLYTFLPDNYYKFVGLGGRIWLSSVNDTIIGGISSQISKNEDETYEVLGADIRFDYYPYQLRSEFVQVFQRGEDTWTAYLEPGVFIYREEVLLYVFGDYLYGANNKTGIGKNQIADPIQRFDYGAGVNWLPTSSVRLRFGLTYSDYLGNSAVIKNVDRDYLNLDLSIGVAF